MVAEEQESHGGLASESIPVPEVRNSLQRPCEEMLNQEGNVSRRKPRLRKKALHALILKQMEFYFSDANLSKDRFLGTLIKSDPYVDLNVFLRFNKIRVLTDDVQRVAKALKCSEILSLSEDGMKVCRNTPINPRDDCEACTVYVQGLSSDANHEWLSSLFSQYGAIAYVSIPRYKSNRKIKGFAFIEFDTAEGAGKCLEAFQENNCTLPSHTAPHELLSITTFAEDEPSCETMTVSEPTTECSKSSAAQKRKADDEATLDKVIEDHAPLSKKNRVEEPEMNVLENITSGASEKIPKQVLRSDEESGREENVADNENKKKKRKRKRGSRSELPDIADLGLQIMAKKDWKQLRNKYLQLQRNKMKELKQHLRKARWNQWGTNYERKDKMEMEEGDSKDEKEKSAISVPKFAFTPGVIVKIELDEPCSNPKGFKLELRGDTAIKYIDVHEGASKAYVRCDGAEAARIFVDKHSKDKSLDILDGKEEKAYWDKMLQDREEKVGKNERGKHRGRDKLLKRAEKELGKHIKFDEV